MDPRSTSVGLFAELVRRALPDVGNTAVLPSEKNGDAGEWSFCIVPPGYPSHRLQVDTRGDSVEVRYDDGEPPGPAEKLWVGLDKEPAAVAAEVIGFLRELMSGRVVVVRERLGPVSSRLRSDRCKSLAWFRGVDELRRGRHSKALAIYRWTQEHSPTAQS